MRCIFVFILLIISLRLVGQDMRDSLHDSYFESIKKEILAIPEVLKSDTIFIKKASYLNDFSGIFEGTQIFMLDDKEIYERTKKGHSLIIRVVHPIEFTNGISQITISTFGVKRKRNKYHWINSGFSIIQIQYDCNIKRNIYRIVASN